MLSFSCEIINFMTLDGKVIEIRQSENSRKFYPLSRLMSRTNDGKRALSFLFDTVL